MVTYDGSQVLLSRASNSQSLEGTAYQAINREQSKKGQI